MPTENNNPGKANGGATLDLFRDALTGGTAATLQKISVFEDGSHGWRKVKLM